MIKKKRRRETRRGVILGAFCSFETEDRARSCSGCAEEAKVKRQHHEIVSLCQLNGSQYKTSKAKRGYRMDFSVFGGLILKGERERHIKRENQAVSVHPCVFNDN